MLSGLAAAGGSHECHELAGFDREAHVVEGRTIGSLIGKAYVLEPDGVVVRALRIVCDGQRGRGEDLVDAPQCISRLVEAASREHDFCQGGGHDCRENRVEGEIRHEHRERPFRKRGGCDQKCYGDEEDERSLGHREVYGLRPLANLTLIVRGLV